MNGTSHPQTTPATSTSSTTPIPALDPRRRGRRSAKVKSGCRTCKSRRVKCDEARPACQRCVRAGRTCEGYGIWGGGSSVRNQDDATSVIASTSTSTSSPDSLNNTSNAVITKRRPSLRSRAHHLDKSTQPNDINPLSPSSSSSPPQSYRQEQHSVFQSLARGVNFRIRPMLPMQGLRVSSDESQYLEWFMRRTTPKMPGCFRTPFWETLIFQATCTEPAVLHAVLALSSAHRIDGIRQSRKHAMSVGRGGGGDDAVEKRWYGYRNRSAGGGNDHGDGPAGYHRQLDEREKFNIRQYNKAIGYLQPHLASKDRASLRVALVTCMIFMCMEFLRENYGTGIRLLQNGGELVRQLCAPQTDSPAPEATGSSISTSTSTSTSTTGATASSGTTPTITTDPSPPPKSPPMVPVSGPATNADHHPTTTDTTDQHSSSSSSSRSAFRFDPRSSFSPSYSSLPSSSNTDFADTAITEAFSKFQIQAELWMQNTLCAIARNAALAPLTLEPIPSVFPSAPFAKDQLDSVLRAVLDLSQHCRAHDMSLSAGSNSSTSSRTKTRSPSLAVLRQHQRLQWHLLSWRAALDESKASFEEQVGLVLSAISYRMLRLYYTMVNIMVATCLWAGDETCYDAHTADFASILEQGVDMFRSITKSSLANTALQHHPELSHFMVDVGCAPPVYYTALKCRDRHLRRHALHLLPYLAHKEGMWNSSVAASVAREVIQLEEVNLPPYIPLENGFNYVELTGSLSDTTGSQADDVRPTKEDRILDVQVLLPDGLDGDVRFTCTRHVAGGTLEVMERVCHVPDLGIKKGSFLQRMHHS